MNQMKPNKCGMNDFILCFFSNEVAKALTMAHCRYEMLPFLTSDFKTYANEHSGVHTETKIMLRRVRYKANSMIG